MKEERGADAKAGQGNDKEAEGNQIAGQREGYQISQKEVPGEGFEIEIGQRTCRKLAGDGEGGRVPEPADSPDQRPVVDRQTRPEVT